MSSRDGRRIDQGSSSGANRCARESEWGSRPPSSVRRANAVRDYMAPLMPVRVRPIARWSSKSRTAGGCLDDHSSPIDLRRQDDGPVQKAVGVICTHAARGRYPAGPYSVSEGAPRPGVAETPLNTSLPWRQASLQSSRAGFDSRAACLEWKMNRSGTELGWNPGRSHWGVGIVPSVFRGRMQWRLHSNLQVVGASPTRAARHGSSAGEQQDRLTTCLTACSSPFAALCIWDAARLSLG